MPPRLRLQRLHGPSLVEMQDRVELVTTESLSPFIGPHILREAEDVLLAA